MTRVHPSNGVTLLTNVDGSEKIHAVLITITRVVRVNKDRIARSTRPLGRGRRRKQKKGAEYHSVNRFV